MIKFFQQHKKGLIATIFFHGLILILLLYWGFTTPLPLPAEQGILINFGDSETGSPGIEPQNSPIEETNKIPSQNIQEETLETEEVVEEEVMDQDFEESASIENKKEEKEVQKEEISKENIEPEEQTPVEEQREVNKKALFPGKNSDSENSNSEGITEGEGNQGSPNGSPNSTNYTQGDSSGEGGISYSLEGRYPESLPKPRYPVNEQGKVVVEVTVDRYGNITSANPGMKGSTTSNKLLLQAAKEAALKAKFDKKPDAAAFQKGIIIYHFVLQ